MSVWRTFQRHEHATADRLSALEGCLDAFTTRALSTCGIVEGMRCLEIGAGAGSIMTWLAHEVGDAGEVVALDVDTAFVRRPIPPNVSLVMQDVRAMKVDGFFDLVHERMVLYLLGPSAHRVLRTLAAVLKPEGWLVVEGPDIVTGPAWGSFDIALRTLASGARRLGVDLGWGAVLAREVGKLGLQNVSASSYRPQVALNSPCGQFWLRTLVAALPFVSETKARSILEAAIAELEAGRQVVGPRFISIAAQRPPHGDADGREGESVLRR